MRCMDCSNLELRKVISFAKHIDTDEASLEEIQLDSILFTLRDLADRFNGQALTLIDVNQIVSKRPLQLVAKPPMASAPNSHQ
jgi:hypothetical protein